LRPVASLLCPTSLCKSTHAVGAAASILARFLLGDCCDGFDWLRAGTLNFGFSKTKQASDDTGIVCAFP
jgi:hypothetical protein